MAAVRTLRGLIAGWDTADDPDALGSQCRIIGERLDVLGGFDLMQRAFYHARACNPGDPNIAEIRRCWAGDWQW
jgi:hypothetical protein